MTAKLTHMKNKLLCAALCVCTVSGFSQSGLRQNEMAVIQHKPVVFSYETTDDLLNPKSIDNAFELKLNTGSDNIKVFATVVMTGGAQNAELYKSLSLKVAYKTSGTANFQSMEIPLSGSPVLLFVQPAVTGAQLQEYSFGFDVKLLPQNKFIKADNYNFSIVFTQTIQ
jgi:hypothetical protein